MLERDPYSGFSFIHVVPNKWGPFVDIRACLLSLESRRPWIKVISPAQYLGLLGLLWLDPKVLFVCWDLRTADPGPRLDRRCLVGAVYSEAMDEDDKKMLVAHTQVWERFKINVPNIDLAFAHTPWMKLMVEQAGLPTFVLPVGWDAQAMGVPRWSTPKHDAMVYHGSLIGRRIELLPPLLDRYSPGLVDVTGSFGRKLLGHFDTALVSLYIAHTEVRSFSTWRLWQIASTSAVLFAEPGDTWPFEPGVHFLELPRLTVDNAVEAVGELLEVINDSATMIELAQNAHELAQKFNVDYISDRYLAPAALALEDKT